MSNTGATTDTETDDSPAEGNSNVSSRIVGILIAVRRSFLLFTVVLGIVMLLLAATVLKDAAVGGLLGLIGVSTLIYALLGYLGLRLIGYS